MQSTIRNVNTKEQDSFNLDAFGRKRVSGTGNRFDIEFIYNKQPLLVDEVTVTGATATHNATSRDVSLAIVNTTTGTSAALYSHFDIPYTPGNSQLVEITGTLDDSDIGGGVAQIFIRSNITGSVVETVYDQTNWTENIVADADWTKSQIFAMDFQSLKVGRIRFALVRNGVPVPVHIITNDNIRDTGYWQRPTLPVCWRTYNDGTYNYAECAYGDSSNAIGFRYRITKNASATMRAICATVKSEGGDKLFDLPGLEFSADRGLSGKTVAATKIPVLAIRQKTTFNSLTNRTLAIPEFFGVEVDNPVRYEILYRPTLTGASWVNVDATYSSMEYDISATSYSGGVQVASGYVGAGKNTPVGGNGILGRVLMSLGRTATSDILAIVLARTTGTSATAFSSFGWKEIR